VERAPQQIDQMTPDLADAVSQLVCDTIRALECYNHRARTEEIAKYSPAKLRQMSAEDTDSVIVATLDGDPVGFCISRYDDGLIWLCWFGVRSEQRRSGVGAALLEALRQSASRRNAHKIWCDTRTSNLASAQALTKAGFSKICELRNHWYRQDFYLWERHVGIMPPR